MGERLLPRQGCGLRAARPLLSRPFTIPPSRVSSLRGRRLWSPHPFQARVAALVSLLSTWAWKCREAPKGTAEVSVHSSLSPRVACL